MQIKRINHRSRISSRRRGVAPLELVLCLPFLVGALAVIFTLASAGLTKSTSAISARHNAWRERYRDWTQSSETLRNHDSEALPPLFASILMLTNEFDGDEGLLEGKDLRNIPIAHPGYQNSNLQADSNHFVHAGAWDHRQIPSKDNGRLIPSNQLSSLGFGSSGGVDLSSFLDFPNADEIGDVGELKSLDGVQDQLNEGKKKAEEELAKKLQEKADLEQQLDDLLEQVPPDLDAIAKVQSKLLEVEAEIKEIEKSLETFEEQGSKLPGS